MDENLSQKNTEGLKQIIVQVVAEQLKGSLFTARKLTDNPTDALQVVNRRYVNMNGISANRPTSSVVGQQYFDTTLASGNGKLIIWNGIGFVDTAGNYV